MTDKVTVKDLFLILVHILREIKGIKTEMSLLKQERESAADARWSHTPDITGGFDSLSRHHDKE